MATPVAASPGAGSPPPSPPASPTPTPLTNAEKATAKALANAQAAADKLKANKAAAEKAKANAAAADKARIAEEDAEAVKANALATAAQTAANAAAKAKAAKAAVELRQKAAAAAAQAAAAQAAAEAAAGEIARRQKAAAEAEAAEASAVTASLLQANNSKRGFITNPITIQFVDAAKKGNVKLLEKLLPVLSVAFIPDTANYKNTLNNALFAAASGGYKDCVNFLIENRASIKIRDAERNTILHAAVKSLIKPEQISDIRGIIDDVHEKDKTLFKEKNQKGETILHLAAKSPVKGSERIVYTILDLEGVDTPFVNAKTKNTPTAIDEGRSNARTALELVHNLNVTKVNNRGRAGRYPMYNVHFKKAKALLDKGSAAITTNIPENTAVYPLLMKYYNKLNSMSGETANIKAIEKAAERAANQGKGAYSISRNAKYYNDLATRLNAKATLPGTNDTRKDKYIRKAATARAYAKSIRNARAREAATRMANSITGVRRGLMGYTNNTARARAAAAAAAQRIAPRKKIFGIFGGTRKNRSRKNKSTRKNRKH